MKFVLLTATVFSVTVAGCVSKITKTQDPHRVISTESNTAPPTQLALLSVNEINSVSSTVDIASSVQHSIIPINHKSNQKTLPRKTQEHPKSNLVDTQQASVRPDRKNEDNKNRGGNFRKVSQLRDSSSNKTTHKASSPLLVASNGSSFDWWLLYCNDKEIPLKEMEKLEKLPIPEKWMGKCFPSK